MRWRWLELACGAGGTCIALLASCRTPETAPDDSRRIGGFTFPADARGAFGIRSPQGASLSVKLKDARPATVEVAGANVRYRGGAPHGGDVIFRTAPTVVEDFVTVDSPATTSLEYEVTLGSSVAGLRQVNDVLEFLDRGGAPRLRVPTPYVVDHTGVSRRANLDVIGCAVDRNGAPPFRRPVTAPGSSSCTLRVVWEPKGLVHPLMVDPGWMQTATLDKPRYQHVSMRLPSGDILIAGGLTNSPSGNEHSTSSVEVYSAGAWASVTPMMQERAIFAAAALPNGDILITGGIRVDDTGETVIGSAEVYSVASGQWSAAGTLITPRSGHTATSLGDGRVLIAAGYDNNPEHFTNAELYSGGSFVAAGDINTTRFFHTAVALPDHRVLIGGGTDPFHGSLATLELYTPGSGWSPASALATMQVSRTLLGAVVLNDGDVLFVGGYNSDTGEVGSTERYRPSTNTFTTGSGMLAGPRYDPKLALLPDGRVLVAGGQSLTVNYADAELYDPQTTAFSFAGCMSDPRAYGHTVDALGDGGALVVGGLAYGPRRIIPSNDTFAVGNDAGAEDCNVTLAADDPDGGREDFDAGLRPRDAGLRPRDAGRDAAREEDAGPGSAPPPVQNPVVPPSFEPAGGCACETAPGGATPWSGLLLVLGLVLRAARRARARGSSSSRSSRCRCPSRSSAGDAGERRSRPHADRRPGTARASR